MAGAPLGNRNASKNKTWEDTLRRALLAEDGKMLRAAADALVAKAVYGDVGALKEIGDRLDGKPVQAIGIGQDPNAGPVRTFHELVLVDGRADPAA
jgi:hypothetical protein